MNSRQNNFEYYHTTARVICAVGFGFNVIMLPAKETSP